MKELHIEQPITIDGSKIHADPTNGSSPPTAAPEYDPFEDVVVAHDQSYADMASRKEPLVIHERKPGDQEWFRVHPDRSMHQRVNIFVDKITNEKGATLSGKTYLVTHNVARVPQLLSRVREAIVYPTMTRQGLLLMWVVLQAAPGKDWNAFPESATLAAERAMEAWVQMQNIGGSYGIIMLPRDGIRLPDPTWPDLTGKELLRKAFSERVISDLDHPLIQALFGYR